MACPWACNNFSGDHFLEYSSNYGCLYGHFFQDRFFTNSRQTNSSKNCRVVVLPRWWHAACLSRRRHWWRQTVAWWARLRRYLSAVWKRQRRRGILGEYAIARRLINKLSRSWIFFGFADSPDKFLHVDNIFKAKTFKMFVRISREMKIRIGINR